jgi:glucose/arabinose dehydrogenase
MHPFTKAAVLVGTLAAFTGLVSQAQDRTVPDGVWVRDGYKLTVAESTIKSPRFILNGPNGSLYVSVIKSGEIKTLKDNDGDGYFESVTTYVDGFTGKQMLQGMAWHKGWLWYSEVEGIYKSRDTNGDGKQDEVVKVIGSDQLPITGGGHRWRALAIHKDRIYTHVGDQDNATDEPVDVGERKKIWSFAMDGSDKKLFASGIRNTEKLVIRPGTDELWGIDHDIDRLAVKWEAKNAKFGQPITDHNPPAELNKYVDGGFYGHPYILGKNMPNINYLDKPNLIELASKNIVPEWLFPAHCSGMGMTFYTGNKIPGADGDAFAALKGGWNATEKTGYSVDRVLFEFGHPYGAQKMVHFLKDGKEILGKPIDCAQAPDGSILFSDDTKHRIYRLTYVGH